jgi:tetratricopeptide (TPR) repeat protein/transcriptional regulator with XRE-family HTH domain
VSFAVLLRRLRTDAGLTQEKLAEAARLSYRSVSDLERGINLTPRKETARLLAEALHLSGTDKAAFEAAARGHAEIARPVFRASSMGSVAVATRTLPRDIASFTGREPELAYLVAAVAEAASSGGVVGICAIGGMAGIGKTALAVHAAYRIAARFPDGQIFLPLHAHTPGQQPVDPADALASLLQAAGIPAQQIPVGLEPRTWLWRDHVAGKRLLLLLDDAAGHEQVRPLLPGTAGTLVLITSRRHLTALEDSEVLSLDTLPPDDAAALLARLAVRPDLAPEDRAAREIARLCGNLPLALGMLARQLHHHPAWTAADLAADLAAARDRLVLMQAENLSVAAAFDLSYQELTPDRQQLFRRLGLHPGTDIDDYAAAALDKSDLAAARRNLAGLYDHYLLTEPARGRYRMHDLIGEHARALAAADPVADREAALARLLDYYLHTTSTASRLITWRSAISRPVSPGRPPAPAQELRTEEQAITWLRTELPNLHACVDYAASHARLTHATGITTAISDFMHAHGHWSEALSLGRTALAAARTADDRQGQAWTLNQLGITQELTGNYPAAAASQTEALRLFRDIGDRRGQAWALMDLGMDQQLTGDYPAAAASQTEALRLFRDVGDRQGQAWAFNQLGVVRKLTGDHQAAAASLTQALELYRDLGDRHGQAEAAINLGELRSASPAHHDARGYYAQALSIARDINAPVQEARALEGIGRCYIQEGNLHQGAAHLRQALAIYRRIGAPEARRVETTLHD